MTDFQLVLTAAWDIFTKEFTLYGITLSWAQVMLWSIVAGLIMWFIGRIFSDD